MTDEVGLVHGPDATAALATAAEQLGGRLAATRLRTVDHRPGRGATAAHDVTVEHPDGSRTTHVLALTTDVAAVEAEPGTLVLARDDVRLGVWLVPHDPALPGLVPAMDPGAVAGLLTACGVPTAPSDVGLRLRAYRPRRRAVVEAAAPDGSLFLKVVPPGEQAALHRRHRELERAGVPAPASLGSDPRGVVVLTALPGTTWRQALVSGRPSPPVADVLAAVDRLPASLLSEGRRPSWAEQSGHHVTVLAAALPRLTDRVADLALAADVQREVDLLPAVPVHGDLYEAQVLVTSTGRVSGLLDLDTAGPGARVDDEACLAAHLLMLPLAHPGTRTACGTALDELLDGTGTDRALLWRRAALVALTLATGPVRSRRPGWEVRTEEWLRVPETMLAGVSGHGPRPWDRAGAAARVLAAAGTPEPGGRPRR